MKIILTADVAGLGDSGDIVEVKDGYARNYLLPRNLAIVAARARRSRSRPSIASEARQVRVEHAATGSSTGLLIS